MAAIRTVLFVSTTRSIRRRRDRPPEGVDIDLGSIKG
jgi:hypothetical protein